MGGWGRGEVTLFAGSFGGTVESCCLCLGLWSPLSTCALQGAGALATAPLLFLLVSTKLLLSEDCRTSVIKNKNESCFTHPTPKSTWKSACTGMVVVGGGGTQHHPCHSHLHPWTKNALLTAHPTHYTETHCFCPKPIQAHAHTHKMSPNKLKSQGIM